jgi:3'(2'), 5'-bisphosphate nucleotidase
VVSEESDPVSFEGFRRAERVLFVDPLDGTQEFIDRDGDFVVMIGLVAGPRPVAGVIHARCPAWPGSGVRALRPGAWGSGVTGCRSAPVRPGSWRRRGLSRRASIVASGWSGRWVLSRSAVREVRAMGSAGLKGAQVAQGAAEVYLDTGRGLQRWDVCAVDALVTAAGGRVSDVAGAPIDYRGESLVCARGLVASNGLVHEAILARLTQVDRCRA